MVNLTAWACWVGWHNWTVTRVRGKFIAIFDERCDWCGERRTIA